MGEQRSKKHHYIPRYYLKGFTNEDDSFFVYDKKDDKIFKSSPGNTFFENNLNTITLKEGDSDFLEKMYAETEGRFWSSLDKIRDSDHTNSIDLLNKMDLFLFLSILHWRLPRNAEHVESLSQKFFSGKDFNFFTLQSKSGKSVPEEFIHKLRESEAFKKSARLMIPFAPFHTKEWSENVEKWNFSYAGDGGSWHMVGDSPIVTDSEFDHDPEKCLDRFIFPVSGRILLISNGNRLQVKELPPNFTLQYNIALLDKAERFIASPNKDLLEAVVTLYRHYVDHDMTHLIVKELFWYLDE